MPVAAQNDHAVRLRVAEELVEAVAFERQVGPLLVRVLVRDELDARNDQPQLGRLFELLFKPLPLLGPEHRGLGVSVRQVWHNPSAGQRPGVLLELAPEVAQVEQDDLDPLALGADHLRVVDALLRAPRRVFGDAEEVEEQLLRSVLVRVLGPGVVLAEVVVVPGDEHRAGLGQSLPAREGSELLVLDLHRRHLVEAGLTLDVGINVVAHRQVELGLEVGNLVEDREWLVLVGATRESDARQGPGVVGDDGHGAQQDGQQRQAANHGGSRG